MSKLSMLADARSKILASEVPVQSETATRRIPWLSAWLILVACFAFGIACGGATAAPPITKGAPDSQALMRAGQNDAEWILPGKTYESNRYTGLKQINRDNVASLGLAWSTAIIDDGEQEASPIVWRGTMYVSTPHDGVLALDAANGKLKWQFAYNPAYIIIFAVSRGVGIGDGKVYIVTQDCRVIALDAETGKQVWNVPGCRDTSNSFFSMAAYVYEGSIIVGHGGGDNGTMGHVTAFSSADGNRLWEWETIKRDTWPGNSWEHGGAAVWSGLAINPKTHTLFVGPGNPGPDMVLKGREGQDLYSNSLVALDISGSVPKVKWHYQMVSNDTHDADPAMIPVLFAGKVAGKTRELVAFGDKTGTFVVLDQKTGKLFHRLAVTDQTGIFTTVPTIAGTYACPNHGGGIEWNGGAYDPVTNLFLIPSTEECGIWKLETDDVEYVPGQAYTGGPLPKRGNGTGWLTAIDLDTGNFRWRKALPHPAQGGALVTASGLVFTSDLGGSLYAFDIATGEQLWHTDTGSSIVAPISAYALGGHEYLAVLVGQAGNQQTPNLPATQGSRVLVYELGATQAAINGTDGQIAPSAVKKPPGTDTRLADGIGTAPYTPEQVRSGEAVYGQQCAVCHGAQLQGVSAPPLTGPSYARNRSNLSQLHAKVTKDMPLGSPGSLSPADYASILAYVLAYDCVKPSGEGKMPFPTADLPEFKQVIIGGRSCPPSPGKE